MLIENEKKLLSATPEKEIFASAPRDFRPHFLHGVQKPGSEFEAHAKEIEKKAQFGVTMEPNWRRWDDPTLFDESDPYWSDCSDSLKVMRENNMFTWIYDEPGYPSGSAGILTLKDNEQHVQTGVQVVFCDIENGKKTLEYEGEYLASFALKLENGIPTEKLMLSSPEFTATGATYRLCVFSVVPLLEATIPYIRRRSKLPDDTISRELLYGYPDLLEKYPTELFIKAAYEPYKKRFADYMGKEIRAFFTDEPTIPFRHHFSPDYPAALPWSLNFKTHYSEKYNENIIDFLPELFFNLPGADIVRCKYYELVGSLFADNFLKTMSDWCAENGMYFTGHFLHEEQLATQLLCSGNLLRCAKSMTMPGTDNLSMGYPGRGVGPRMSVMGTSSQCGAATAKVMSSGAHLSGNIRTASESHGWSCPEQNTTFASYIATANWQFVLGINTLPYYTMNWKNSDADQFAQYTKYASRMSYMTAGGVHKAPVAMLHPFATAAAYLTPLDEKLPSVAGLGPLEREYWYYNYNSHMMKLQNVYDDSCTLLLSKQTDFDYVEDCDIANAEISNGMVKIGGECYQVIFLPSCEYISHLCATKLLELMDNGIKVISAYKLPNTLTDSDDPEIIKKLCIHKNMFAFDDVKEACNFAAQSTKHAYVSPAFDDIYVLHKTKHDNDIFFICNNSINTFNGEYILPTNGKKPQLWNAFDGKTYDVDYTNEDGVCKIKAKLYGHQGHLIVFTDEPADDKIDLTKDIGLPYAESVEKFAEDAKNISLSHYNVDKNYKTVAPIINNISLHAPEGGLHISDKGTDFVTVSTAADYRNGEILEGATIECILEPNAIYEFSAVISEDNIEYWGIMPRHYDKNGNEVLEKGFAGNWRNEFAITLAHKPCKFTFHFNVPGDAVNTKILISPLSKRLFSYPAGLTASSIEIRKIDNMSLQKEYVEEKGKVCSL